MRKRSKFLCFLSCWHAKRPSLAYSVLQNAMKSWKSISITGSSLSFPYTYWVWIFRRSEFSTHLVGLKFRYTSWDWVFEAPSGSEFFGVWGLSFRVLSFRDTPKMFELNFPEFTVPFEFWTENSEIFVRSVELAEITALFKKKGLTNIYNNVKFCARFGRSEKHLEFVLFCCLFLWLVWMFT